MIKFILLLLFIILNLLNNVYSVAILAAQNTCLDNFVAKFNVTLGLIKNADTTYNYCSSAGMSCSSSTGDVQIVSLTADYQPVGVPVSSSDLTCLPKFYSLYLYNFEVNEELLYYTFPGLYNTLNYTNVKTVGNVLKNGFSNNLPYASVYEISSNELIGTTIKMSYFNNVQQFRIKNSGNYYIEPDEGFTGGRMTALVAEGLYGYPNFTRFTQIVQLKLTFDENFIYSSISNFSTILPFNSVYLTHSPERIYPTYFLNTGKKFNGIYFTGQLEKPKSMISANYMYFQVYEVGPLFNINGEIPVNPTSSSYIVLIQNANITVFPKVSLFNSSNLVVQYSNLNVELPKFVNSIGKSFDFSFNNLYGTVDQSWCNTVLTVSNNSLSGTLPSCITCYLSENIIYNKFIGNQFTNMGRSQGCPTFRPKVTVFSKFDWNTLSISGTDIGYDPLKWKVGGTTPGTYGLITPGSNYSCNFSPQNFQNAKFVTVQFLLPLPGYTYTFAAIVQAPTPTGIKVTGTNQIAITGQFFSSYLTYVNQTVTIEGIDCVISTTSFTAISCTTATPLPTNTSLQLVTISTDNLKRRSYIKTIDGSLNNVVCAATCNKTNQICDLSSGFCYNECENGCNSLGGTCNVSNGICECNANHQGVDCSLPIIQCSVNCGSFGNCDTTIGKCVCDNKHQGEDCSIDFIQCPISNNLICNGGGSCNNVTGACNCNNNHIGFDCSIPYYECLGCNLGTCNTTIGKCVCDNNHQGEDCSIDFIQCPISNNLICSNQGSCNNVTGACNCNNYHIGLDCSIPYYECLECNLGICNTTIGSCICDQDHQGPSCDIPFKNCPLTVNGLCNNQGNCNNQTSICTCNKYNVGEDCSITVQDHYISSILPSTTDGGEAVFYGFFDSVHIGLSLKIGDLPCEPFTFISSKSIKCIAKPGQGIKTVELFQNSINYTIKGMYKYIEISPIYKCPNNCSGNGICNSTIGECKCNTGFSLYDCSGLSNNNNNGGGNVDLGANIDGNNNNNNNNNGTDLPPNISIVDKDTGKTNITNQGTTFEIYFKTLSEINFNGDIVKEYTLENNWNFENNKSETLNVFTFNQLIQNGSCSIISKIEEVTTSNGVEYNFAGTVFTVENGGIKFTISISNYTYENSLNTLKLDFLTTAGQYSNDDNNKCNEVGTTIDTVEDGNLFNYIKISKNNKIMSGRFISKVVSDGKSTYLSTKIANNTQDSITVSLYLPHFTENVVIDPDFAVLISPDFKVSCDQSTSRKWVIPISVILPVAGAAAIAASGFLLYKKKFVEGPLKKKLNAHIQNLNK